MKRIPLSAFIFYILLASIFFSCASFSFAQNADTALRADLIIHTDTSVPAFYAGRALPTGGSNITATILLFDGTQIPSENFTYAWEVNGIVQNNRNVTYLNHITFSSVFETRMNVSVRVFNKNGVLVAEESASVPIVDPELYFYELNPLRGITHNALPERVNFIGEETTLSAQPYHMNTDDDVKIEWKINNQKVSLDTTNPLYLTLQKQQNTGKAVIDFKLVNPKKILQNVKKEITFQF